MSVVRTLQNDRIVIRISPFGGAVVDALLADGRPFMRGWQGDMADFQPRQSASYPLVPFGNRVGGNAFTFEGHAYSLEPNTEDALYLHGEGWSNVWDVEDASDGRAVLSMGHDGKKSSPHVYEACQTFELIGPRLAMTMEVVNRGDVAMPFGIGFHPFFRRRDDTVVSARAQAWWTEGAMHLPGRRETPPASVDFSKARQLSDDPLNNCFEGWNGEALVASAEDGFAVHMRADPIFSRYMLYTTGPSADFVCIEPMSHTSNGFHMPDNGGLKRLAPGEAMRGTVTLTVEEWNGNHG